MNLQDKTYLQISWQEQEHENIVLDLSPVSSTRAYNTHYQIHMCHLHGTSRFVKEYCVLPRKEATSLQEKHQGHTKILLEVQELDRRRLGVGSLIILPQNT